MSVQTLAQTCGKCGGNSWYVYEYSTACRGCVRERQRSRRDRDPHLARAKQRAQRYGVPVEVQAASLAAQNGRCKLCERPFPEDTKFVHLDHCHKSGKVRGWLCHTCNVALGHYEKLAREIGLDKVERYLR